MKYLILTFIAVVILFLAWQAHSLGFLANFGQTQKIDIHNIVLEKVEDLGKLELVKYTFRDVYEHKEVGTLSTDKVVLIIAGEAVGCVDLKKIKKTDILERNDSLIVSMPKPEICYYKIDQKNSRVYDSFYLTTNSANLFARAYKEAEKAIKKTAEQSNILEQTQINAKQLLKPLFEQISKKKVILKF
jgi:hypothetical protein